MCTTAKHSFTFQRPVIFSINYPLFAPVYNVIVTNVTVQHRWYSTAIVCDPISHGGGVIVVKFTLKSEDHQGEIYMIHGKSWELQKDSKAHGQILHSGRRLAETFFWGYELNWSAFPGQLKKLWGERGSDLIISHGREWKKFLRPTQKKIVYMDSGKLFSVVPGATKTQ